MEKEPQQQWLETQVEPRPQEQKPVARPHHRKQVPESQQPGLETQAEPEPRQKSPERCTLHIRAQES